MRSIAMPVNPSITQGMRQKYQAMQSLLGENSRLLEIMADLEADLRFLPLGSASLEHQIRSLLEGTLLMIEDLNQISDGQFQALYGAYVKIENRILEQLNHSSAGAVESWVVPLTEIGLSLERSVGGKAANLGEVKKSFPQEVPEGFALCASAYESWISDPILASEIRLLLDTLEVSSDRERFQDKTRRIREIIETGTLPSPIKEAILAYARSHWPSSQHWAVRSSAVGEDASLTFAGQFASFLNVPTELLPRMYQKVVASRFSDRAISYRLTGGLTEVETPMAVLFLPLIQARSAGVLYTQDPGEPGRKEILISATWGLAGDLVGGRAPADLFRLDRQDFKIKESQLARKPDRLNPGAVGELDRQPVPADLQTSPALSEEEQKFLAELALKIEKKLGHPQDIEWVIDPEGKVWILQARPLRLTVSPEAAGPPPTERPFLSGGITIFPGRAVAPVQKVEAGQKIPNLPRGVILVAPQAIPEIGAVLPNLAGFVSEQGQPTGHAATLLREFAVPSLFELPGAMQRLESGTLIGLDATHRQIFLGNPWPDVRERTLARLAKPRVKPGGGLLQGLILTLKLTDPQARNFRPEAAGSIHDLIRFVHEKGIAALFEVGDQEARKKGMPSHRLVSPIPLYLFVLDLGGGLSPESRDRKDVAPEHILSNPFQALWKGMVDPRVSWAGRKEINLKGFASVMSSSLSQDMGAMRKMGDPNYLLVAGEYMNLNIRLAYHYAMIDSLISPVTENNYVNFRFRGGGGSLQRRDLRARFLRQVLLSSRFSVDQRGDLVTAWLRGYPQPSSEAGLILLGRLMGCARQLDMLMENEAKVNYYVDRFLAGDYQSFA
jgi:pyruvate,water dikinase